MKVSVKLNWGNEEVEDCDGIVLGVSLFFAENLCKIESAQTWFGF